MEPLCVSPPSDTVLEPEELSYAGPPDLRNHQKCEAFNTSISGCERAGIGKVFTDMLGLLTMIALGGAHGDMDDPILHVCSWIMTDHRHCGRNHSHLHHQEEMAKERVRRVHGADAVVESILGTSAFTLAAQWNSYYYVDAKGNMVPDTSPVTEWRQVNRKSVRYVM